jgi:hypothetical protein
MKIEDDIRQEITKLPSTLADLCASIYLKIERSAPSGRLAAERVLKWLLISQRPLSSEELIAAASISSEGGYTALSKMNILDICCNLGVLDEELDIFRFAHLSVQEYLESRLDYTPSEGHALAVESCLLTYLEKQSQVKVAAKDMQHTSFQKYSTIYWLVHYQYINADRGRYGPRQKLGRILCQEDEISLYFSQWTRDTYRAARNRRLC